MVSAHRVMVDLARRQLAKRVVLGGDTTQYIRQNYTLLSQVARKHGYALAVHGSLLRDVDIVAIPWVSRCKAPSTLIKALHNTVLAISGANKPFVRINNNGEKKPHGRLAWSLYFSNHGYLDISVMPMKEQLHD